MTITTSRTYRFAALLALLFCVENVPFFGAGKAYASGGASAAKDGGGEGAHKKDTKGKEKKSDAEAEISGGKFSGDPVYVRLPVLILPVISSRGAQQTVTVLISIEVDSLGVAGKIYGNMPRVMDALMRALYGKLGDGDLLEGKLVNIDRFKEQAAKALTEIAGPGEVRNVLIQGVAQRIY